MVPFPSQHAKTKNTITGLKDTSGTWHTNSEDIMNIVTQYFGELFTTSYPSDVKDVLECIQPRSRLK